MSGIVAIIMFRQHQTRNSAHPRQDIWPQLDIADTTPFKAIFKTAQEDTVQSLMENSRQMVPDSTLAATNTSNYYWLATYHSGTWHPTLH